MTKNSGKTKREVRSLRTQQIIFSVIALIVILSMVIAMISN